MNLSPRTFLRVMLLPLFASLAGCWMSTEPLIDEENASTVPFLGKYSDPEGSDEPIVISAADGQAFEIAQGERSDLHYAIAIGEDFYLVQFVDAVKKPQPIDLGPDLKGTRKPTQISAYFLINWDGEEIALFEPECRDDILGMKGVEGDATACVFGDLEDLKGAASAYIEDFSKSSKGVDVLKPWEG